MAARKKSKKKAGRKKKATRRRSSARKRGGGGEVLVVASKVKAQIKAAGCATGGDAIEGLNGWVEFLIGQAAQRAAANGRKTVRAHDFLAM